MGCLHEAWREVSVMDNFEQVAAETIIFFCVHGVKLFV